MLRPSYWIGVYDAVSSVSFLTDVMVNIIMVYCDTKLTPSLYRSFTQVSSSSSPKCSEPSLLRVSWAHCHTLRSDAYSKQRMAYYSFPSHVAWLRPNGGRLDSDTVVFDRNGGIPYNFLCDSPFPSYVCDIIGSYFGHNDSFFNTLFETDDVAQADNRMLDHEFNIDRYSTHSSKSWRRYPGRYFDNGYFVPPYKLRSHGPIYNSYKRRVLNSSLTFQRDLDFYDWKFYFSGVYSVYNQYVYLEMCFYLLRDLANIVFDYFYSIPTNIMKRKRDDWYLSNYYRVIPTCRGVGQFPCSNGAFYYDHTYSGYDVSVSEIGAGADGHTVAVISPVRFIWPQRFPYGYHEMKGSEYNREFDYHRRVAFDTMVNDNTVEHGSMAITRSQFHNLGFVVPPHVDEFRYHIGPFPTPVWCSGTPSRESYLDVLGMAPPPDVCNKRRKQK